MSKKFGMTVTSAWSFKDSLNKRYRPFAIRFAGASYKLDNSRCYLFDDLEPIPEKGKRKGKKR